MAKSCLICAKKDAVEAYKPFCSKRCADVDLAKWLTGSYAIPSDDPEDIDALEQALDQATQRPH